MDISTGQVGAMKDLLENGSDERNLVPINNSDLTTKQKQSGKVSLHDHRSKLGKLLTRNQAKRKRRKLKGK